MTAEKEFCSDQLREIYEIRDILQSPSPWLVGSIAIKSALVVSLSEQHISTAEQLLKNNDCIDILSKKSPWLN